MTNVLTSHAKFLHAMMEWGMSLSLLGQLDYQLKGLHAPIHQGQEKKFRGPRWI